VGLVVGAADAERGFQLDGDGDGGLAAVNLAGQGVGGGFAVDGVSPLVGVAEVQTDGDLVAAAAVPPGIERGAGLVVAQQLVERGVVVDAGVEVGVGSGRAVGLQFLAAVEVEVTVGDA
jgi:hypothetical protein